MPCGKHKKTEYIFEMKEKTEQEEEKKDKKENRKEKKGKLRKRRVSSIGHAPIDRFLSLPLQILPSSKTQTRTLSFG